MEIIMEYGDQWGCPMSAMMLQASTSRKLVLCHIA